MQNTDAWFTPFASFKRVFQKLLIQLPGNARYYFSVIASEPDLGKLGNSLVRPNDFPAHGSMSIFFMNSLRVIPAFF